MKTSIIPFDDFFELMGAAGSASGALKALAAGDAAHLTPERLREIANRLSGTAIEAGKSAITYNPDSMKLTTKEAVEYARLTAKLAAPEPVAVPAAKAKPATRKKAPAAGKPTAKKAPAKK